MSNVKISELPVATIIQNGDYLVGNADGVTSRVTIDAPNGVAVLDDTGRVASSKLPAIALTQIFVVASNAERDALTVQEGDVAKVTDDNLTFVYDGSQWIELVTNYAVDSVNGETGVVTLTTSNISEGTNLYFTEERAAASSVPFAIALG